jgi:protease-4
MKQSDSGRRRWTIGCLAAAVLVLLFAIGMGFILFAILSSGEEEVNKISPFGKKIGIVRIRDVIYSSEKTVRELKQFRLNPSIVAVILRIESPGGGVAASQEIFEAVKKFKSSGKKIYASMGSISASGAYYIACGADSIWANPGTITGSIGVIFRFPNTEELLRKVGIGFETIKSGKYKDAGAFHRKITEEERAYLQSVIDDAYEQFIEAVASCRGMALEEVKTLSDGRVFTGRQGLKVGLIDTLGTYEDLIEMVAKEHGLGEKPALYEIRKRPSLFKRVFGDAAESGVLFDLNRKFYLGYLME